MSADHKIHLEDAFLFGKGFGLVLFLFHCSPRAGFESDLATVCLFVCNESAEYSFTTSRRWFRLLSVQAHSKDRLEYFPLYELQK